MSQTTAYAIIDAEGWYGNHATVWAVCGTIEAARATARRMGNVQVLAGCEGKKKGDKIAQGIVKTMVEGGLWSVVS